MKIAECGKCKSSATYCVAVPSDDESGLRAVGAMMRHVCAICGFEELVPDTMSKLAPSVGGKQSSAKDPGKGA